jgi:lipopolysaccharide/colanic/teichoic acid biosynthesis glycosyltransferase
VTPQARSSRAAWSRPRFPRGRPYQRPRRVPPSESASTAEVFEAPPDPVLKRALDVVLALIGIIVTAPVWLIIAIAIKLDDRGPVFFHQARVGKGGILFDAPKFRTMVPDADGTRVANQGHPDGALITRVGRFLRPMALDELPQLLSILRGDMSFVGPRAVPPQEIAANGNGQPIKVSEMPGYRERHLVRPGLTGPAQVRVPRDIPYRQKFRYDVFYVQHRTLRYDVQLIVQSIVISFTGRWPEIGKNKQSRRNLSRGGFFSTTGTTLRESSPASET